MTCQEDVEIILDTFGKIMYVYGDEIEPLQKCKLFVATVVQEQLKAMLQQAKITAEQRRCDRIEMIDIIFLFRRHHKQLNRMFQYLQSADLARTYARYGSNSTSSIPSASTKLVVDDPEDDVALSDYGKEAQKMYVAISLWDVTGEVRRYLKESPKDEVKTERIRRMTRRTDTMDLDSYKKFSEARLCSMISPGNKKNDRASQRFLNWLGNPDVSADSVLLLSYIASEMICAIVEGAVIARQDEDSSYFSNEPPVNSLQMRHYEQSLRRSRGYMERGNVLTGYF